MRRLVPILAAGVLVIAASAPPAFAKTLKECRADYSANKDAVKASGQTKKDYLAACKTEPSAAAPSVAPTAAAAPAASIDAAPILTRTKAQCAAEYQANIAAIKANGQSKAAFDADCRSGTEKIPRAAKVAPPADAAAKP